jgi:E3 ubiquitin ligase SMURF1/2/E3 ubiquitin-protein ligase NEDD4
MSFVEKQLWFLDRLSMLQRPWSEGHIRIEVDRDRVFEQSASKMMFLRRSELHQWMRICFRGEEGLDAGGLEREWFGLVAKKLFSPETGLFTCSSGEASNAGNYNINPLSGVSCSDHTYMFQFAGRFIAKAIMEQQNLPAYLSLPLRKQILSLPITFSDLEFIDVELYQNLIWLLDNNDVEHLGLYFTIDYQGPSKQIVTYELKPGGSNILVTDENKEEYLQLRLKHRMLDSIKPQLERFLTGFYEVLPPELLCVFDYQELELLMCGVPDINVSDWKKNTEYIGLYNRPGKPLHRVIRWFWEAVESMSPEERVRLLQFVTGSGRLPVHGFQALQSNDGNFRKFNIQSITKEVILYLFRRSLSSCRILTCCGYVM